MTFAALCSSHHGELGKRDSFLAICDSNYYIILGKPTKALKITRSYWKICKAGAYRSVVSYPDNASAEVSCKIASVHTVQNPTTHSTEPENLPPERVEPPPEVVRTTCAAGTAITGAKDIGAI